MIIEIHLLFLQYKIFLRIKVRLWRTIIIYVRNIISVRPYLVVIYSFVLSGIILFSSHVLIALNKISLIIVNLCVFFLYLLLYFFNFSFYVTIITRLFGSLVLNAIFTLYSNNIKKYSNPPIIINGIFCLIFSFTLFLSFLSSSSFCHVVLWN